MSQKIKDGKFKAHQLRGSRHYAANIPKSPPIYIGFVKWVSPLFKHRPAHSSPPVQLCTQFLHYKYSTLSVWSVGRGRFFDEWLSRLKNLGTHTHTHQLSRALLRSQVRVATYGNSPILKAFFNFFLTRQTLLILVWNKENFLYLFEIDNYIDNFVVTLMSSLENMLNFYNIKAI